MTTPKDMLAAMPLDGNTRIATPEQLGAYVKAVSSGALGRLGAKANPMKELGAELVVEGIMAKFAATGTAVFCGHRFRRSLEGLEGRKLVYNRNQ
jgi:hypothetical protein